MTFEQFERAAHGMWSEIPEEYREGIDGIVVKKEAESHSEHEDYYTLGMCFTEPYPSDYGGPETTRSIIALYYGSFRQVAENHEDFPWEEELWETITHELRHHLEFLADEDALEGLDYAMEQTYRREEGLEFDPWYFESGPEIAPDVYRVEYDIYIERRESRERFRELGEVEFEWDEHRWTVLVPERVGDVHFIRIPKLDAGGGWLTLVLVREQSLAERIKRIWRRRPLEILESEADARRVGEAPGAPGPEDGRPGRAAGGPPAA